MNSTLINGVDGQVFRVEPRRGNPKVLNITLEYPNAELLGLATWVENLELYLIFQVGVVGLPHPIACTKREKLPEILQALLKITPQPTCGQCINFDAGRGCCRVRRDTFVSWTACLLPVEQDETACSKYYARAK